MTAVVISSGHGQHVQGAVGYLNEVEEARRVVVRVGEILRLGGVSVVTFHDNSSHNQSDNLETIVNFHNSQRRDYDVSVHFNAHETTGKPVGTEVLYLTQEELAADIADAISDASELINRGAKQRTDLYFLNRVEMPAVLIEVCFVDSSADCDIYIQRFEDICQAIAGCFFGEPAQA
jgi:N-acetylmuramoyl-L-alanine amidase